MQKRFLTREQALQKLRHYCGYQERSHADAVQKLWDLGVGKKMHDEILSVLIEEDYINEERFAKAFARGKFRMNDWGRKKIVHALKEKKVSDYNIRKAMKEIDESDYKNRLAVLLEKKHETMKNDQFLVRKKKLMDYLLQKGFEHELISSAINKMEGHDK